MYLPHHEMLVRRVVQRFLVENLDWPTLPYVTMWLRRLGIDPSDCLDSAPSNRIRVDESVDPDGRVLVTVRGFADVDLSSPVLSGFVPVLRRCYDDYVSRVNGVASSPRGVVTCANAKLLGVYSRDLSRSDVMIAGLLLEADGLVKLERLAYDAPFPWQAVISHAILHFGAVGVIPDYLAILTDLECRPEKAS